MAKTRTTTAQGTKNKTNKIAEIAAQPTSIYHRFIRYPSFPIKPVKKIIHSTNEGGTIVVMTNNATVEDEEKLFALVYLIQQNKAETIDAKIVAEKAAEDDLDDNELVIIKTTLAEMKKITNAHDYNHITQALLRMSGVLMINDFINPKTGKHEKIYIRPIFKIDVSEDNKLTVYMFKKFLNLCLEKTLTFDLEKLLKLPPVAKNLYFFLYANMDKKTFDIATIAERTLLQIDISEDKYLIRYIRRAFDALKKNNLITNYEIDVKNRKVKPYYSKKALEQDKKN